MKTVSSLLLLGLFVVATGCGKKEDPRDRPNFVDTSDPSKVLGTMNTPKAKSSTALGGGPSGPGGAGAGTGLGTTPPKK